MKDYKFTIFTPCYNGEKTIERVFNSVANQTYKNFEWIIVNDGSKDKSKDIINELRKKYQEIDEKIIYLEQKNMGKHMAWNRGVETATGDLFLSADADDSFLPNTLEYFNEKINAIPDVSEKGLQNSIFSGINVCVYDPANNKIVGTPYPKNGLESNNVELQYKYDIRGEHWGIVRTDLLKRNKFPVGKGPFWAENRLWFTLAKHGYKVLCFNDCLRAYFYEQESLTHAHRHKFNRDVVSMFLKNEMWILKELGGMIYSYSIKGYLGLYCNIIKYSLKYFVSLFTGKQ